MNTLSRASNILLPPGCTSKTFLAFVPPLCLLVGCGMQLLSSYKWWSPVLRSLCRLWDQKLLRLLETSFMAGEKKIKVKFSSTFSGKYLVTGVFLKTSQSTLEATPCLADLGLAFCQSDRKLHALSWLSWRLQSTVQPYSSLLLQPAKRALSGSAL